MRTMSTNFTLRATIGAIAALALGLSGCTSSNISIGDGGTDGGSVVCGSTICSGGDVCCNASCGICAAPGEGCIALYCGDGGMPDGGESCGTTTCGGGEQCCTGCTPDDAFCMSTSSGVACPDYACPPPRICGDTSCGPGDICCDNPCDGTSFCTTAGAGCPVFDCPPPPTCGTEYCSAGESCCDNACDGTSFCNPGDPSACPIFDCPPPPICGSTDCAPGEVCCADCSGAEYCSAGGCPADPCPPPPGPCSAQDARGEGVCGAIVGIVWDGSACTLISGCSCVGADCHRLYMDIASCNAAHVGCGGASCGGFGGGTCAADEYCGYAGTVSCGAGDGLGTCTARPSGCSRVYDPVCGCDGRDYSNACIANLNGTDVSYSGICPTPSDCRTTGCAMGSTCTVCGLLGTLYSCVPDGTICVL